MPDDVRTQAIEKRIDKGVAGGLSVAGVGGPLTIVPNNMNEAFEFAKLMAISSDCIRPAFRNNPGACLALSLQAWRWGADPFAVANKAYITKNNRTGETQIAYEAQLIHAIVNASGVLTKRLRAQFEGVGQQRKCRIVGWIRGEDEPFEYESPPIAQIAVKNSPLWQGDPDQQLHYYSERAWARRHVPEVLLGIYTGDEIDGQIIDATPVTAIMQEQAEPEAGVQQFEPFEVVDHAGQVYEFEYADKAIEAVRKMLIAAAVDPKALATCWENNAGFLDVLYNEKMDDEAMSLERLYAELQPKGPKPEPEKEVMPAASSQPRVDTPPPSVEAGAVNPGAGAEPEVVAQTTEKAMPAQPEVADDGGRTAGSTPATGATTKSVLDPFWTKESLRIDPTRDPRRGTPMWKQWPALLLPRIRQAQSTALVKALWSDNGDHLDAYGVACGEREKAELVNEFDARIAELGGR